MGTVQERRLVGFHIENVRQPARPERVAQAIDLWLSERVLPEAEARRRATELLMVAVEEATDSVVGVCTTYLQTHPGLRMGLWYFRTFVAAAHRENDIGFHLLLAARDFHEAQFCSGADSSGQGLYMEIENPIIQRYRNEAVWPTTRMSFIGFNARGDHCRVCYFPGARIPT